MSLLLDSGKEDGQRLDLAELRRGDGDVVFALATGTDEVTDDQYPSIEAMAALAVERAILNGVRAATGLAGVPGLADQPPQRRGRVASAPPARRENARRR